MTTEEHVKEVARAYELAKIECEDLANRPTPANLDDRLALAEQKYLAQAIRSREWSRLLDAMGKLQSES